MEFKKSAVLCGTHVFVLILLVYYCVIPSTVVELQTKVVDYEQQITDLNQKVEEAQQAAAAASTSNAANEDAVGGAPPPPPGPPPPPPPPPPAGKKCLWSGSVHSIATMAAFCVYRTLFS